MRSDGFPLGICSTAAASPIDSIYLNMNFFFAHVGPLLGPHVVAAIVHGAGGCRWHLWRRAVAYYVVSLYAPCPYYYYYYYYYNLSVDPKQVLLTVQQLLL